MSAASQNAELKAIYIAFCSFGKGKPEKIMDGKTFRKALKDSKIESAKKGISSTTIDLVFAKVKAKGTRKIDFLTFCKGLEEIAKRGKTTVDALVKKIIAKGGPTARGTKAANVRLARKDQFCGIATRGGPSTVDSSPNAMGLGDLLDRSSCDIRGRKIENVCRVPYHTRYMFSQGGIPVLAPPTQKCAEAPTQPSDEPPTRTPAESPSQKATDPDSNSLVIFGAGCLIVGLVVTCKLMYKLRRQVPTNPLVG